MVIHTSGPQMADTQIQGMVVFKKKKKKKKFVEI